MFAPRTSQRMHFGGSGCSDDNGFGPKSIYSLSGLQQLTRKKTPKPISFISGYIAYLTALSALCCQLIYLFIFHCRSDSEIGSSSSF